MRISFQGWLKRPYDIAIVLMMLWVVALNIQHKQWMGDRIIEWDVKSYYAWLPATFIYNDLSLDFVDEDPGKFGDLIWPVTTPTGKKAIVTSMGMAILYSPFFLMAHAVALLTPLEADGYSPVYRLALNLSALFYVLMGLIFLRKILLRWFSPWVTTFTLVAVFVGTNLFYYTVYEPGMSHGYNFALIAVFLYYTIRWHERPGSWRTTAGLGLLAGLITLVRPTNIIVLLLFFLWDVDSLKALRDRFLYFLRRPALVAFMALCFLLVWVPQFIYWKYVSGMFFYFSYGELGGGFFWHNPQIANILFSYKKGWFVYTPLMLFAFMGIFLLPHRLKGTFVPVLAFQLVNIYILASWWSWWFGGGFGLRAFIDSYAIMAIPFATLVSTLAARRKWIRVPALAVLGLLIGFGFFQMRQYRTGAIHYWWMNKEAYWETFLKRRPTPRYWELITIPDYEKARQGIYEAIPPESPPAPPQVEVDEQQLREFVRQVLAHDSLVPPPQLEAETQKIMLDQTLRQQMAREMKIRRIEQQMRNDPEMVSFIKEKARKQNLPVDTMFRRDAIWIFENKEN